MLPRPDSRPTHRRRATVFVGAVWLLALAACADDTTAPKITKSPEGPNAIKLQTKTWVTARFVDDNNTPAYPLWVSVTPYRGSTYSIGEGEIWGDSDPREGFIKALLPSAPSYSGCLTGVNAYYVWDTTNNCRVATPGVTGTADLGAFHVHRRPEIYFYMRDRNGTLVKGSELDVTGPDGVTLHIVDGAADDDPADGVVRVRVGAIGTASYCETVPPTGYLLAKPACGTVTTTAWGQKVGFGIKHTLALMPPTNPF